MTKQAKLLAKLKAVSPGGASFNDVVTLLEAYGFQRRRATGSHWVFVYTDAEGKDTTVVFPAISGQQVKQSYVRMICGKIDEVSED